MAASPELTVVDRDDPAESTGAEAAVPIELATPRLEGHATETAQAEAFAHGTAVLRVGQGYRFGARRA